MNYSLWCKPDCLNIVSGPLIENRLVQPPVKLSVHGGHFYCVWYNTPDSQITEPTDDITMLSHKLYCVCLTKCLQMPVINLIVVSKHFGPFKRHFVGVWKRASVTNFIILGLHLGNRVMVPVSIRVSIRLSVSGPMCHRSEVS